jgi:hypothetical protein
VTKRVSRQDGDHALEGVARSGEDLARHAQTRKRVDLWGHRIEAGLCARGAGSPWSLSVNRLAAGRAAVQDLAKRACLCVARRRKPDLDDELVSP